jgi:lipopolysaccharide assembly outer membrane protein LptD (OstA)
MVWCEIAILACSVASVVNATPDVSDLGSMPLEVNADRMQFFPGENLVVLTGNVSVIFGGVSLCADRVVLDRNSQQATARGNVMVWDQGEQIFGEEAIYNFRARKGVILDAEYDGFTVFAKAKKITLQQTEKGREYLLHESQLTTCDLPVPHYHLSPETIRIIPEQRVEAYETAAYVRGVPVAYLPYVRRSLRDEPYGYVFTPGYSSKKGAMFLNEFGYHHNEWVFPELYLDGFTRQGIGVGASNRFGRGEGSDFYGRGYGYFIDSESDNPYLDPEDNIGKDVDEQRWRAAGHFYRELWSDLVFSSRFQKLSDEDFNRDFDDVGRHHGFSGHDLESDRNSFVNLAQRWDDFNLRVLYKERLHDFYLTELPDDERKPQVVLDAKENRILESPFFWDALFQYDHDLTVERQQSLGELPALGIEEQDDFQTVSETDRLHGEAVFSVPFSISEIVRVIPRAGAHANIYEDTRRTLRYLDHFGNDDSYRIEEFDSLEQTAFQAGIEFNSRGILNFERPLGKYDETRLVVEPNVAFDVFRAREDLAEQTPETLVESSTRLARRLPELLSIPEGFPAFDDRDIPLRDAEILAFRLDTKLQGRGTRVPKSDLLAHSISVAYDFESKAYEDLQSELFVRPAASLVLSNFVAYDLNYHFARQVSVGASVRPAKGLNVHSHYSGHQETETSQRQESMVGGVDFRLGDKYALGFSSRVDLDEGDITRVGMTIGRDLHDAVATVLVVYKDGKNEEEDEIDLRFHFDFAFSRPGRLLGEEF